ncbi:MAG TPA: hypothetical protein VGG48_06780 [Rhizomicrobium sp.]|jgi:general secretion pathway protein K
MSTRRQRGVALATVLWGIAALSLIAAAMLSSAVNAVRISRNAWTQVQARSAADAGVQSVLLSLFDPKGHAPLDGRARHIAWNGADVTVSLQDEMGRIDLNAAPRDALRDLFKGVGADDPDALADRVVDWRGSKPMHSLNGASAADYAQAGAGYHPRGGPFQSVDELGLVLGVTPDLLARVTPALTVYSHRADFDMRVAPKEALLVIPGMSADNAAAAIAARGDGVSLDPLAGHAVSITAEAEQGRAHFIRHAVVLITGDPARPYWILDWR